MSSPAGTVVIMKSRYLGTWRAWLAPVLEANLRCAGLMASFEGDSGPGVLDFCSYGAAKRILTRLRETT